jgi:iron complex outermembrane receptor protein
MRKTKILGVCTTSACALVTALSFTESLHAQDNSPSFSVEEIVVRARYREESLQDVPSTVTAITQGTIENAGVERAEDFIRLTPGVSLVDTAEVGDTQVSIRGMNNFKDTEASFAFILDGIVMTNPAAFNREYGNLQQIEILKGPQGALYGRNASSGAMIFTTKKPGNEKEVDLKANIAENNSYFLAATFNTPIIEDKLAMSIHGNFRTTDGFFRNRYLDEKAVDDFESYNVDGRLVWTPNERATVDIKVRYGEVSATPANFNAAFALPAFAEFLNNPLFFEDVNDHKEFEYVNNVRGSNYQDAFETSMKVDYDFDDVTLTGWMLYSNIQNEWTADGTSAGFGFFFDEPSCEASTAELFNAGFQLPSPQALGPTPETSIFGPSTPTTCDGYQHQVRDQEDFSFELRLSSSGADALRWTVGLYFLDINREVGVAQGIDTGGEIIRSLYNPPGSSSPTEALSWDDYDSTVYAAFGNLAYDITEDIEISAALRFDREERKVRNLVPTDARTQYIVFDGGPFTGGAPLNPGLNPAINPDGVIPPQSKAFEHLQPKVTVSWDTDDNTTVYGSWGVGFKSGGFNSQGSAATVEQFLNQPLGANIGVSDSFKKEVVNSFEVGFKSKFWDNRVSMEGALYRSYIEDMQFFEFFVGPFGLLRQVNNIDKSRVTGAEFTVSAYVTEQLNVYAGTNVMDTKITKNTSRPGTEGNEIPYAPKYSINLGAQYTQAIIKDWEFIGRADWQMTGPTWFHTLQGTAPTLNGVPSDMSKTKRNAYNTLNLRIGVQNESWSIIGYAENIFNEKYPREVIPAPEFGGAFIFPNSDRRLFGVEIRNTF